MPTPRRRTEADEQILPMAEYQSYINQIDAWPHIEDDGAITPVPVDELHHARATNALHKLRRWQDKLYESSTNALYEQARVALMASPLVGALIEQALGEFYTGTYLSTTTAAPHLDEMIQAGADNLARILDGVKPDLAEDLLEASITGAVELDKHADKSIGARARILYHVLATTITEAR
jgi:hypothetical protein